MIIRGIIYNLSLIEEYDIETVEDIQETLKDLLGVSSPYIIRKPVFHL